MPPHLPEPIARIAPVFFMAMQNPVPEAPFRRFQILSLFMRPLPLTRTVKQSHLHACGRPHVVPNLRRYFD